MYADRYAQPTRFNPGGLTAAIAINAGLVAALIFAAPTILPGEHERDAIPIYEVPTDPPPPPPEPQPRSSDTKAARPMERIDAPVRSIAVPVDPSFTPAETPPLLPAGPVIGNDPGPVALDPPKPTPLPLVAPRIDPRYARDFQPAYPAAERRAEREGRVTVRVLVGIDGRVKQVERVSATSDAFWQATLERAQRSWRFTPATRGSVPEEAWRTLSLTFVLEG